MKRAEFRYQHVTSQKVPIEETRQAFADPLLVRGDDRGVRDRQAQRSAEHRGDRELDVLGVAVGYGRIGGAARGLASDASVFTGLAQPARDYETVLEATYQVNIAPWWTLQPDLQFVFHPGGHVAAPAPAPPTQPISNALVLGLRSAITF